MSYLYDIRAGGASTKQYDQTNRKLGFPADVPEGLLFHVAMLTEDGGRVVELWESEEDQQAFVEDRLAEALQEAGIGKPDFEAFEVHDSVLGEGPIESGVLVDMTAPDADLEVYDAVTSELRSQGDPPEGLRFHAGYTSNEGLRVVEVWDDLEAHERHVERKLTPVLKKNGVDPETIEVERTKLYKAHLF